MAKYNKRNPKLNTMNKGTFDEQNFDEIMERINIKLLY